MGDELYGIGIDPHVVPRPQCWRCGRTLAEYLAEPYSIRCSRCKAQNKAGPVVVFGSTSEVTARP